MQDHIRNSKRVFFISMVTLVGLQAINIIIDGTKNSKIVDFGILRLLAVDEKAKLIIVETL